VKARRTQVIGEKAASPWTNVAPLSFRRTAKDFAFNDLRERFLAGGSNDKRDQSLPSGFEFIVPKCSRR
jgi:hypothetical protein